MKILVVDCDARASCTIAQLLAPHDVGIDVDAYAALDRVTRAAQDGVPYALVLCELAIGRSSGTDLIARLKALRQPPTCVLMSSYERIVEAALVEEVLMKPFVHAEVEELLARVQARREMATTLRIRAIRRPAA